MTEMKTEGSKHLKYPSKYVRTKSEGKRPLWRRMCLNRESQYCYEDENEESYSEEMFDTFNCHICNVEVPVLFFKEHNDSEKHVTLKEIFRKVLERVSKQINISVINNDKDIDKDVYYCVPCSKIIKIENKLRHESSQHHVTSQRGISVVHEFYKIFAENKGCVGVKEIENEEILDEKRDLSANNFGTEIIPNHTKNNNVKDVTNEDKNNNDETKTVCSTNTMKPTRTVKHLVSNDKHNEELTSEENYFKEIFKQYNLKANLPIVDGEFIHVASPSGVRAKISRDHFHSYQSIVEGIRVYCRMCNEPVELREESMHKVSEKHARKVFLPVNEQFARTVNDYFSHCLICNEVLLTTTLSEEYHNDKHIKILNSTKLTDICQNNEDLAKGINTENNIERAHSKNHTIKIEENKIIECINNKEYISKVNLSENHLCDHSNESGHFARTDNATSVQKLVFCKLCNVSVLQDQIEYHNAGTPHWSNALKNIFTGVADGVQAYFSKDNLKTDSDSFEKQNDIPKNDNVTKHDETPKNDNVAKHDETSKNDNVAKHDETPKNYNVAKHDETPKKDNVAKLDETPKNDNVAKHDETPKNDNVAKHDETPKNDNVAKHDETPKNDNVAKHDETPKNDNVAKHDETPKNDNVAKHDETPKKDNVAKHDETPKNDHVAEHDETPKNDHVAEHDETPKNDNVAKHDETPKNDNVAKHDETPKNDHVAEHDETPKNDHVAEHDETPKNDNVAKHDETPKNDNVAKHDETPKNDNVAKHDETPKNDNVAKHDETPKNDNVAKHDETPKNDNVAKHDETPKNDNVASTSVSNITNNEIDSSSPFRYADSRKNKITCIVCDVDIANIQQSIRKHEASSNHKSWLRKLLHFHTIRKNSTRSFCECCCDINVTNIWGHIGTERHTALLQLEYEIDSKALKFYKHKSNSRNYNGIISRELYKNLLECNKIYKLPNSNFYCTFCELELLDDGNEIDHMFSAAHENWLKIIFKSH